MTVAAAEAGRILRTGWVWAFLALCALANLIPILTAPTAPAYDAGVVAAARQSTRVDATLIQSVPTNSGTGRALRRDLDGLGNVFATTDYQLAGRIYIQALHADGYSADALRQKYDQATTVAADRARSGAGESLYLAAETASLHTTAFRTVLPAVTIESILLATLLVLHVIGIEQTRGTAPVLYSSRTGRRLALIKAATATVASLAGTLLLSAAAWAGLLVKYPIASIAGSDVESGFNLVDDQLLGTRPFLTWFPMTVAGYALATLVLALAITLVFAITAAAITTVVREPYFAFAALLLGNGFVFALPLLAPLQPLPFFFVLTPVWLWLKQAAWFTDGGYDVLWPHFETLGALSAAVAALVLGAAAHRHFLRKDLQ